ncbi:MAG: dipicolinate synthase subunit DpsA [Oscillospiraceae bacterium]|nr:dipicolinate synthase subunit DpsA [Oscillospiraceae bacterium]
MKRRLNIWIIGGDMRQGKLAEHLLEDEHTVHTFALEEYESSADVIMEDGLEALRLADCVILPLPVLGEGSLLNTPLSKRRQPVAGILDLLCPEQMIFAGMVSGELTAMADDRGLTIYDYFRREELAVTNAVPTAEGAIQIALEEMPVTLHAARVLVIGYGRVGKMLAYRLDAMGAKVSVAARSFADLAWIEAYGYGVERSDQLEGWLCAYDLVINTVPARILTREALQDLNQNCLVIDVASKPGGVDFDAAAELGIRVIWALSLPGKVAPTTAGEGIKKVIYNIMHELGV